MKRVAFSSHLFAGLASLGEASFPKRCRTCGREYANAAEYIAATVQVRGDHSGLKEAADDDGNPIVELFRNCVCGSTLLENFGNRRDPSEEGQWRRDRFDAVLAILTSAGMDADRARDDLRRLVAGPSDAPRPSQGAV